MSNISNFIDYLYEQGIVNTDLCDELKTHRVLYEDLTQKLQDAEKNDNVNHPKHYCREGGMECLDEMLMLYGAQEVATWCKLNAHKYRYRAADKNGKEDIAKSDFYMKKYKELTEKINKNTVEGNGITWAR